jgi:hypothetical protein
MNYPQVSIDDDHLSTQLIGERLRYLSIGNEGDPRDPTVEWEDEDEQEEAAMWLRCKEAVGDDARFEDGIDLIAADDDGNLPAAYAEDYYESVYDRVTVEALAPYVDWGTVAADLGADYENATFEDDRGGQRTFLYR